MGVTWSDDTRLTPSEPVLIGTFVGRVKDFRTYLKVVRDFKPSRAHGYSDYSNLAQAYYEPTIWIS